MEQRGKHGMKSKQQKALAKKIDETKPNKKQNKKQGRDGGCSIPVCSFEPETACRLVAARAEVWEG